MNERSLDPSTQQPVYSSRRKLVLLIAVIGLTLPAACFSGVVLLRWGPPANLHEYVSVLNDIPDQIGSWRYVADGNPVGESVVEKLDLRGYVHRVYEHPATGQRASLLLLVGPAGPLVRHPPEICYGTAANELLKSQEVAVDVNGTVNRLRVLSYASDSLIDGGFLVAYGFGADEHWDIPESPRMAYGGRPVLFKLQVLTESVDEVSSTRPEGLINFLAELLPVLNAAMAAEVTTN